MFRRLALLLCLAGAAPAADTFTLTFADGKKRSLPVESFDEQGLTVLQGGEKTRIAWDALEPGCAYRTRRDLTGYDDGAARLELANFAARLRLYPEAFEQLEIALALGGLDEAAFEKRSEELEAAEVGFLTGRIDALLASGEEPSVCLQAIKRLKERYPAHPKNALYEPHVQRLVEAMAKQAEAKQSAEAKEEDDRETAALRAAIEKLLAKKAAARSKGEMLEAESKPAIEKRQVSRVERTLAAPQGAERYYKEVRNLLRAIAKLDKRFRVVAEQQLQAEYDEMEQRLVACYLEVARILLSQRNYKGAIPYVQKILFYDPIHEEALEMVEKIRKNRITFKVSNLTNAHPRVSGG